MLWQVVAAAALTPEMARLAKAMVGDWQSVEVVQYGKPVPAGQGRRGAIHVHLAGGGTVLVDEGHSTGNVGGELTWYSALWWDTAIKRYQFLTCFKASDASGCELRGTAHWIGNTFVNEYQDSVRDVWSEITANSHTLTEFHKAQPYVVSRITRMP